MAPSGLDPLQHSSKPDDAAKKLGRNADVVAKKRDEVLLTVAEFVGQSLYVAGSAGRFNALARPGHGIARPSRPTDARTQNAL